MALSLSWPMKHLVIYTQKAFAQWVNDEVEHLFTGAWDSRYDGRTGNERKIWSACMCTK